MGNDSLRSNLNFCSSAVGDADGDDAGDDAADVDDDDDDFLTAAKSSPLSAPLVSSRLLVSLEEAP
jgi:hypothetical protein